MHSLRQSRDLLISAPSSRVCRSLDDESAALSEPARSTSDSLPASLPSASRSITRRIAWEREEVSFAEVAPVARASSAWRTRASMLAASAMTFSTKPNTWAGGDGDGTGTPAAARALRRRRRESDGLHSPSPIL